MKPPIKRTNNESTTLLSVWLPKDLARELGLAAKRKDLTKSQVVRKAIKLHIKQTA